jgi:Fe2+ transport system protein FeoA
MMNVRNMNPGDEGSVVGYATKEAEYRQKLLRMGLTRGARFKVIRRAPLGDPIELEVRGFRLTLRGKEADGLEVKVL